LIRVEHEGIAINAVELLGLGLLLILKLELLRLLLISDSD